MSAAERSLFCPKCGEELLRQEFSGELSLWRCRGCKGMLLEAGMLERVSTVVRADEFFDIGHPKVGRALDVVSAALCPLCAGTMCRSRHPSQPHVFTDNCLTCFAVFLDAGELLDLSSESWLERLWEALTGGTGRR